MTKELALKALWSMSDKEFTDFLNSLPARVGLAVRSGLVKWVDVLPEWYIKTMEAKQC